MSAQTWLEGAPDGLPVANVVGVCFTADGRVVVFERGQNLSLPTARLRGWDTPESALVATLGPHGVRVHRSGPLCYRTFEHEGGTWATAFRVAAVSLIPPTSPVPLPRRMVCPGRAKSVCRGVNMRLAQQVAALLWQETDQAPPPVPRRVPVLDPRRAPAGRRGMVS